MTRTAGLLLLVATVSCSLPPAWEGEEATGLPPLYRSAHRGDRHVVQVLYPIFQASREPGAHEIYLAPFFWDTLMSGEAGRYDRDWALLPFFYGGQDDEVGNYFLFFPFGGNLKGLLGYDEMTFAMFPLYLGVQNGEYEATNILWPLLLWGEGGGHKDFRIAPFYSSKEIEGKSWSRSVLWPLVSWGQEDLDTEHPTDVLFIFPFYGETESDVAWSRTYLFPFFQFAGNDAGWSEMSLFWPIYRRVVAPDGSERALKVWPFYSITRGEGSEEGFFAWPFGWFSREETEGGEISTFQFVPFYRERTYASDEGDEHGEVQVWPLFKHTETEAGSSRFRLLAPIPFTDWEEFEANFGWAWTLLDVRSEGERDRVDLLSGLLGYESSPEEDALRLLWFIRIPF